MFLVSRGAFQASLTRHGESPGQSLFKDLQIRTDFYGAVGRILCVPGALTRIYGFRRGRGGCDRYRWGNCAWAIM